MTRPATMDDLDKLRRDIMMQSAPATLADEVGRLTGWKRRLEQDAAVGRSLAGPQWIDDVAIRQGAVTAEKLEATLVLATAIIAGAVSPADRLEIDATGIKAYGTVSSTPNTNTLSIQDDGDFTFGVSPNQIAFVAATGTLTVPAAVITSLTIADVGSGTIGGNYDTGSSNPKLRLSTSGIEMWNSGGTKTVNLASASGSFTLSNDPAGSNRITISDGGIELWKGGTREFYLRQGSGAEAVNMLLTGGGVGEYIGFQANTGIWTGASSFGSAPFRVNTAGALTATSATITGAITATSGSLSGLSVTGNLTLSGSGLFRTGSGNPRVEIDTSGIYAYNSSGTNIVKMATSGSPMGFLGASTTFSWDTSGNLTLAGFSASSTTLSSGSGGSFVTVSSGSTAFSAGNATPGSAPFRVTSGGALTASSATITGSITASSLTITGSATFSGGTLTLPNGGTITSTTVDINGNSAGAGTFGNMNIDGTVTLASGGKIVDADGSYWDDTGITFFAPTSQGDSIHWKYSGWGNNRPYSVISNYGTSSESAIFVESYYGNGISSPQLTGAYFSAHADANRGQARLVATGNGGVNASVITLYDHTTAANSYIDFTVRGNEVAQFDYTNRTLSLNGYLYPGNGTSQQANVSIRSAGTHLDLHLSDTAGSSGLRVLDSGGTVVWLVNSDGQMSLPGNDTSAAGTYYGRVPVAFNGLTKYIHLFNA